MLQCRPSLAKQKLNLWHWFKTWLTIKEWYCIAFAILAMFIRVCVFIYHYYSSARVTCFVFAFESKDITQKLEFCIALKIQDSWRSCQHCILCLKVKLRVSGNLSSEYKWFEVSDFKQTRHFLLWNFCLYWLRDVFPQYQKFNIICNVCRFSF